MNRLIPLIVGVLLVGGCGTAAPVPFLSPGSASASSVPALPPAVAPLEHPAKVDIPAIDATAELVSVGLDADRRMEIPPVSEVGVYDHAPMPGAVGPSVLAGHVNYKGTPGAFARLAEVEVGDDIVITDEDGRQLVFDVYEIREFPKTDPDWGFVFGDRADPELVAVTCSGDVINHHYTHNTAVAARLVQP